MSAVGTITRLAGTVVTRTAQVVTHPVETTRYAAGLARDVAGTVLPIGQDQPVATRDRPPVGTEPLTDPSLTKGVLSESDALRKASERE